MSLALKISRSIDNHVWKIIFSLDPSKFSESDRQLISKFGEPEINVGGTFLGPISREENKSYSGVIGVTQVGSGTGATFNVSRNGAGAVATVTAVSVGADYTVGDIIKLSGLAVGGTDSTADVLVTVTAVLSSGELDTFSFTGGATLGPVIDSNQYELPDKYIRIRSDLPFVQEFEARAGVFSTNTKIKVVAFEEAFIERYTAAILTLRGMNDTFTGESIINI